MSWKTSVLGDVCQVSPRDPALPESAPFVPMAMVDVGSRYPTGYDQRCGRGGVRARAEDILFARITPCLENGKLAQLPADAPPTGGSTEFIVVRPGPAVDPGFIYYWCMSPSVRKLAEAKMTGTTGRMRLAGNDLARFALKYPPLDQQRRIVEILEDHLSRLEAASSSLLEGIRKQDQFWVSTLSRLIVRVEHAPTHALGAVADSALGKMLDSKKQRGEPYPYLRNVNVRWRQFDLRDIQSTLLSEAEVQRFAVWPGDVMVCEGGEPGRCAVWRNRPENVAYQKALHRIRVHDPANLDSDFLALVLEQAVRSGRCDHLFTGTTIRHLPQEKLRTIPIPLPTMSEQVEVHRRAKEVLEAQFRISVEIRKTQHQVDALRRSLLTAAFSGHLTRDRRNLDTEELVSP